MGVKRKQHSAQFKAEVAMAALSGEKTLAGLSAEYGVHPTMISTWKQELVKCAGELFERGNKQAADPQKTIDALHRKIGQLCQGEPNFPQMRELKIPHPVHASASSERARPAFNFSFDRYELPRMFSVTA
jgi:transposase-like protein